jgi:hypothetical protein
MMEGPPRLPAYLMWGVGGASLVVGAAFGIAAISAKNDFNDMPTYGRADAVHRRAIISDVGFGLGLILVATGTLFYFGRDESPTPGQAMNNHAGTRPRLGAAPLVGPGTGGGLLTMKF